MPKEQSPGKPTVRRYSPQEKAAVVRMVRALRAELGTEHPTVRRVARQLGYGVESLRTWVRQADIDDGYAPRVTTAESQRVKEHEQEIRELMRANVSSSSRFLRLSSRFSRAISLGTPSRCPASTSIWVIHRRRVSVDTPNRLATAAMQAVRESYSST